MIKQLSAFPQTKKGYLEGLSIVLDNASSAFVSDTYIWVLASTRAQLTNKEQKKKE